jgi:hypothetical protein
MFIQLRNLYIKKSEICYVESRRYDRKGNCFVITLNNLKTIEICDKEDIDIIMDYLKNNV